MLVEVVWTPEKGVLAWCARPFFLKQKETKKRHHGLPFEGVNAAVTASNYNSVFNVKQAGHAQEHRHRWHLHLQKTPRKSSHQHNELEILSFQFSQTKMSPMLFHASREDWKKDCFFLFFFVKCQPLMTAAYCWENGESFRVQNVQEFTFSSQN